MDILKKIINFILSLFKKKRKINEYVPAVEFPDFTIEIPDFNWTNALKFTHIVWHHSFSPDNVIRDWDGIVKYHTSYRVDYRIVSKDEFFRMRREGQGKRFEKPWRAEGYYGCVENVNGKEVIHTGRPLSINGAHAKNFNGGSVDDYTGLGVCLLPNTLVLTDKGYEEIKNIKIGDIVLGRNEWTKVINTNRRTYEGSLIKITGKYSNIPLCITPEHPILSIAPRQRRCKYQSASVCKKNSLWCSRFPKCKIKMWKDVKANWNPASKIKVGDWICINKNNMKNKMEYLDCDNWNAKREKIVNKKALPKIKMNYEFGYFLGLYIAEGTVWRKQIRFHLHKKEKYLAEKVLKFAKHLGLSGRVIDEGKYHKYKNRPVNSISAAICSVPLGHMLTDLCGKGAHNKHLPPFVYKSNKDFCVGLIDGILAGDGYLRKDRNGGTLVTVSKELAFEFSQLYFSVYGIIPSVFCRESKSHKFDKRVIKGGTVYYVEFLKGINRNKQTSMDCDNETFILVKSIEEEKYNGFVFNIETEDKAYTAERIIVHNCAIGNFDKAEPDKKTWKHVVQFSRYLLQKTGLTKDKVIGHRETFEILGVKVEKTCPGSLFSVEKLRKEI